MKTVRLLVAFLVLAACASPVPAMAAAKTTLVLGVDISDTRTFDPARQFEYSPPITMRAAYETLVTMTPGDYVRVKPLLAKSWKLVDGGKAWQFQLREGVKFASGNPLTAEDVKFSFERLQNVKDQPADLTENLAAVEVVDPLTVKLVMVDKNQPLLNVLASITFAVVDSKTVQAQGGTSAKDAEKADKATAWLDAHSAGTGPYTLTSWVRNSEVVLERNKSYWRAPAAFERVVLRHSGDSAAQLLALRRSDIDAALNLTPDQLDGLAKEPSLRLVSGTSLDYMYMTLTGSAELNKALANRAARQAAPRHRLRRHHQGSDGRPRDPTGFLHPGGARWLDRGLHQGGRLPAGPGEGEEAARGRRGGQRLHVQGELRQGLDRRDVLRPRGPEDPV